MCFYDNTGFRHIYHAFLDIFLLLWYLCSEVSDLSRKFSNLLKEEYESYDPACKIMFWLVGGGSILLLLFVLFLQ